MISFKVDKWEVGDLVLENKSVHLLIQCNGGGYSFVPIGHLETPLVFANAWYNGKVYDRSKKHESLESIRKCWGHFRKIGSINDFLKIPKSDLP